ncbi:MAG: tRNA preQ1(34) S-adenosylmethionine ribosyltransferase-isomerase QueA [Deltaproteobacteria bacterium]|nr:MAG: tRNA preQ1(34) S-adenosylmethionine ribosyltransferase-isomerase QueA [Deltaproteobacteria bacterium]
MKTEEFDYHLPPEAIAQEPAEPRDSSRLLVLDRSTGELHETVFRQIVDYLRSGDVLVLNDTRVIPARLHGRKPTGGRCEVFLLRDLGGGRWEALVRPARRLKPGSEVFVGDVKLKVIERTPEGTRVVEFPSEEDAEGVLQRHGEVPLPPYIKRPLEDPERYQTVFARSPGSTAASTAALHFTKELLDRLQQKGVKVVWFTLHMGLGSFRPIKTEEVEDHRLPPEIYTLPPETASEVNRAKAEGRRVIACGTGAVRVLEGVAGEDGMLRAGSGMVDIFILPGYKFRVVDGMITNFHLPRSSHLVLVSAFAGREEVMRAYRRALEKGFRFLSFGDAMLIL